VRVLVAEDDPTSRHKLKSVLTKAGYEVVDACDGEQAWQLLQTGNPPRLAILDWMMPGMDGLEVCRRVRQGASEQYVYLILLTSNDRKQDVVRGMEAGADDYLTKPFDTAELKVRLRAGERILDLQQRLIAAQESLRVQATHDPLTGLWNHGEILDILRREVERAQRERSTLAVVMADVDHFKAINDTHGHLAGDAVLREVASRLLHGVRPYDPVGRYGGEEFLIVVPGCNPDTAVNQAERLRESIGSCPIPAGEASILATLSLGITVMTATATVKLNHHALLKAADEALYLAKKNGRNRVEVAPETAA
jgi:two-component system, cell cycle response regulator